MIPAFIQGIGPLELVIVLVIVLLIFGPKRLPGLARSAGNGLRELRGSIAAKDGEGDEGRTEARPALARPADPEPAPAAVAAPSAEPVPERR